MAIDYAASLWGGPAHPPCLSDSLLQTALRMPKATAVIDDEKRITYADLMAWSAGISSDLDQHGSGYGGRVGVAIARSADAVAALVALTLTGRTYVPLDMDYPKRRLEYMLSDSKAELIVYTTDHGLSTEAISVGVRPFSANQAFEHALTAFQVPPHDPDLPVYIIYTSGSTGWPKGVLVQHSCLDNVAQWQAASSVAPDLRTAQFAPLNFDVSFQEIFGTLCAGGTLVIVPESLRRDAILLLEWLAENQIQRLFLPYVALQMLAVAAAFGGPVEDLSLREINVAGEQLVRTEEIVAFFRRMPQCRLANHYGQSESAMVSYHVLPDEIDTWPMIVPIGAPLPGCELLLDAEDPAEGVGELLVAGLPVSLGYLGQPELNVRRYIEIERTRYGNMKAFRTGDLVKFIDGGVHLLTRMDDDVKLRGVRINLGEVEAQLMAIPEIAVAVAVVVGEGMGLRMLRAGVTLKDSALSIDEDAVLERLSVTLPEVSVPLSVSVLDVLPKTPSGKLDRQAACTAILTATRKEECSAPRSPVIEERATKGLT